MCAECDCVCVCAKVFAFFSFCHVLRELFAAFLSIFTVLATVVSVSHSVCYASFSFRHFPRLSVILFYFSTSFSRLSYCALDNTSWVLLQFHVANAYISFIYEKAYQFMYVYENYFH